MPEGVKKGRGFIVKLCPQCDGLKLVRFDELVTTCHLCLCCGRNLAAVYRVKYE